MKPAPFNPDYRPGYAEALEKAYTEYCEGHPEATREELVGVYQRLAEELKQTYPRIG